MDWTTILKNLDADAVRAFVHAARHVVDAMLIETARVRQTQTPGVRDYDSATLSREAAPGGWISQEELRNATQRLAEAIAAEKWTDGFLLAIRLFAAGGAL